MVLFLHGWGCNYKTMLPLINKFKKDYKCVCVDFFGHGKSCEMPYPLTIFDFSFAVETLLKKLKIDEVIVVAHSFGARVGILLASQKNIVVSKMIMFGPAGLKPKFSLKRFFKIRAFKFVKFLSKIKLYSKQKLDEWGSVDYKKLSPTMKKTFLNVVGCDLKIFLPLISAKTLVVVGEKDCETPPYMAKIFCRKMPNCKCRIIDNCGHFCFLEKNSSIQLAYSFSKC